MKLVCKECGGKGYLEYEGEGLYIRNPCRVCNDNKLVGNWNIPKGVKRINNETLKKEDPK